jgi:hypothetical protein
MLDVPEVLPRAVAVVLTLWQWQQSLSLSATTRHSTQGKQSELPIMQASPVEPTSPLLSMFKLQGHLFVSPAQDRKIVSSTLDEYRATLREPSSIDTYMYHGKLRK